MINQCETCHHSNVCVYIGTAKIIREAIEEIIDCRSLEIPNMGGTIFMKDIFKAPVQCTHFLPSPHDLIKRDREVLI